MDIHSVEKQSDGPCGPVMLPKAVTSPQEQKGGGTMTNEEFGEIVRQELDKKHIIHAKFAEDLGISPQLLHKRLNGGRWTIDECMKAIKILKLSPGIFK